MFRRRSKPGDWVTESWAAPLSLNRLDTNSYSLLQYSDVAVEASSVLIRKHLSVRRVIVDLGLQAELNADTDFTNNQAIGFTLYWGVFVVDADDTDIANGILDVTQHTLMQSSRCIQCGQETMLASRWVNNFAGSQHNAVTISPSIKFDWRGRARLNPDDRLVLVVNTDFRASAPDSTIDDMMLLQLSGFTRVLTKVF